MTTGSGQPCLHNKFQTIHSYIASLEKKGTEEGMREERREGLNSARGHGIKLTSNPYFHIPTDYFLESYGPFQNKKKQTKKQKQDCRNLVRSIKEQDKAKN